MSVKLSVTMYGLHDISINIVTPHMEDTPSPNTNQPYRYIYPHKATCMVSKAIYFSNTLNEIDKKQTNKQTYCSHMRRNLHM